MSYRRRLTVNGQAERTCRTFIAQSYPAIARSRCHSLSLNCSCKCIRSYTHTLSLSCSFSVPPLRVWLSRSLAHYGCLRKWVDTRRYLSMCLCGFRLPLFSGSLLRLLVLPPLLLLSIESFPPCNAVVFFFVVFVVAAAFGTGAIM